MSRSWLRGMVVVLAAWAIGGLSPLAVAATAPLPVVPQMVTELYLPEEQKAVQAGYAVYAGQSEGFIAKLHGGVRVRLEASRLSEAKRRVFAAWFNSARWGCDPPEERLDAEAVARAALVLTYQDGVVELALQSPEKGTRKKLAIACTPVKAEWVRDGLPLLPWWGETSWSGGCSPPQPRSEGLPLAEWRLQRALYAIYAGLSSDRLRRLHREGRMVLEFSGLPAARQDAIARTIDARRLAGNRAYPDLGFADSYGRPPDAVRRHFGITKVVLGYGQSLPDPDVELAALMLGVNMPGVNPCPRPFRVVYVALDEPYPPPPSGSVADTHVVAVPAALQRSLLQWRRDDDAWRARWTSTAADGTITIRDDAPPAPRHPR